MIEIPKILFVVLITLPWLAFAIGWDLSVRRFRARRQREQSEYRQLQNDMAELAEAVDSDQTRLGIDTGKEYVVLRVQRTLDDIRQETPPT